MTEWRRTTLLGRLPMPVRREVLAAGSRVVFPSRHVIIHQGAREDHILLLTSGLAKIVQTGGGKKKLLGIRLRGDAIGEIAAFTGGVRTATSLACGPVHAERIPRELLFELMDNHSALAVQIAVMVSVRLRSVGHLLDIQEHEHLVRMSWAIADMVTRYGTRHNGRWTLDAELTQAEIGSMVGISERSAWNQVRILKSRGLIVWRYRTIEVIDMPGLRRVALAR